VSPDFQCLAAFGNVISHVVYGIQSAHFMIEREFAKFRAIPPYCAYYISQYYVCHAV
jgi:hypothetical protein